MPGATLASPPVTSPPYDADFYAWALAQAALIRAGRLSEADLEHVAEEIEDLAKRDRRELESRVGTVIEHMMKLQASPATDPRAGWEATIDRTRLEIARILRDSPSLRRELPGIVASETDVARRLVERDMARHGEVPTVPLDGLAYAVAAVLGD
ncbi:MAG: DUF29 domain-containing protein [Acetobacteraceae bacterium]|nr:DUF29 domain-containing protein [Acetobacteraceae bacterium]